jgi:hypothetical protein
MKSIICTLFEGHYHYGVAALVNSLYKNGFRGDVYAGYMGALPVWANVAKKNTLLDWNGASSMDVAEGLQLHFLPVSTERHLTNYKPSFMLALQAYVDKGLFYFDPDIVIKCSWNFFEEWIEFGVALVQEIISNNLSPNNPKRLRWNAIIEKAGRKTERHLFNYFNGGFCGVKKTDFDFIELWAEIIDIGINDLGLNTHHLFKPVIHTDLMPFGDQDAMNIAAMCCRAAISDFGPEGMDFTYGGWLMSHKTAPPKPWTASYLSRALKGYKPGLADKHYWAYANLYIQPYSLFVWRYKWLSIKAASFINRFYAKE